jgi:hypothetical protein
MESYGGSCEIQLTSQVRVNGDLSEAFPLSASRPRGPLSTLLFDIDDPWLTCMNAAHENGAKRHRHRLSLSMV